MSDLEDFGRQEDQQRAAARIAELLAENTELREAGVGYSQQTVDAITRERDALRQRVTELEARDAVQYERMAHFEADNAALRERWDTLVEEARACYTTTPDSTWPSL